MGVQGLTTIVDKNAKILLKDKNISNTKLVIDGESLIYFLYENSNINLKNGGNYDVYAKIFEEFFSALRLHQIYPYVVMDGGYEPDNRKHETHVRRAKERIDKSREITSLRTTFVQLLYRLTFLAVIEKMNIPFGVCEFEADHDFFVYDLRKGYLPLKTLIISKNCCKGKL